jgi:DNA repair protein RadC
VDPFCHAGQGIVSPGLASLPARPPSPSSQPTPRRLPVVTWHAPRAQRAERATRTGQQRLAGAHRAPNVMQQSKLDLGLVDLVIEAEIACGEQPQQRMENFGAGALSDTELIALMLQNGLATREVLDLSSRLIYEAGSLRGLAAWQPADFERLKGIGRVKARQLSALVEIARRMMMPSGSEAPVLNRPELIAAYFAPIVRGLEIEKFWTLCLNRKNRLKKLVEVTSGTATSSLAHPREVFRAAIREGATGIVCVHNHPSGDPAPSAADVQVTRQLRDAARTVDIELLDRSTGLGLHVLSGSWYLIRCAKNQYGTSFRWTVTTLNASAPWLQLHNYAPCEGGRTSASPILRRHYARASD